MKRDHIPPKLKQLLKIDDILNHQHFKVIYPNNALFQIVERSTESPFYFLVESQDRNTAKVKVKHAPSSVDRSTVSGSRFLSLEDAANQIRNWAKTVIDDRNSTDTIFDDPIIEARVNDYMNYFDKDFMSVTVPLSLAKIEIVELYLNNLSHAINSDPEFKTINESEHFTDDIATLKESIYTAPQVEVAKGLAFIWAKISKYGKKGIILFVKAGIKDLAKKTAGWVTTKGSEFLIELVESTTERLG